MSCRSSKRLRGKGQISATVLNTYEILSACQNILIGSVSAWIRATSSPLATICEPNRIAQQHLSSLTMLSGLSD